MTATAMPRDPMTQAAVELFGWFVRATGTGRSVETGFLNESDLAAERKWWCKVQVDPGTFVISENKLNPVEAMEDCKSQIIELAGFDAGA